jgi:hypothetical protein
MSEESIVIEYRGKQYTGRRSITGSRQMYQTIYYGGRSKADGHAYKPGEETNMRVIAQIILRELVEEELRGI